MKSLSRQEQRSAQTRAVLLRAARRLFATRGYASTPTEEVVRRARVTRGALYHHFRDKRDLFLAVLDSEQKRLAAQAAEAAAREPDAWAALHAASAAFLDACLDGAVRQIVLIDGPAVLGAEQWRVSDQGYYLAAMKALIEAAAEAELIEAQPPDPLAHVIFGALHEAAMLIAGAEDKNAVRAAVGRVIQRLFDGFGRKRD